MTRRILARAALVLLLFTQSDVFAQFAHPGALHSAVELKFLKSERDAQSMQWADFNARASAAFSAPLPNPVAEFYCGRVLRGQRRHPACTGMRSDGHRAYTLALQWYFTGEQRYANRALDIIRLWQREFCAIRGAAINADAGNRKCKGGTYIDDRGQSAMEASWIAPHFVNAAEILRHADGGRSVWTATDTVQFNIFLGRLQAEMDERSDGANYSNSVWTKIEATMAIAIFRNDRARFDGAVNLWRQRVKTSIYMKSDGSQPKHVPNRTGRALVHDWNFPIGFDTRSMPDGLQAETCRDLNHADMAFTSQTYAAHMAYNQGIDLFDAYKNRLSAFMEFHNAMRNGVRGTQVCKSTTLFNKAKGVLATAERSRRSQNNGASFANKIKASRDSLKWKKSDISVQSGNADIYRSALASLGGAGNQGEWTGLLTQNANNGAFDRNLRNMAIIADISYWREWPSRRPKCYGGRNNSLAYPCGRNGSDVDLWYLAYHHLNHRLGLALPMTRITINNYAANGLLVPSQQFIGLSKWESLGGLERGLFSTAFNAESTEVIVRNSGGGGATNSAARNPGVISRPVNDEPETVRVDGNMISWPDDGWYQVQTQGDYREVCAAGRSCWVPSGMYNVINHTTGQRFEGVRVD